MKLKRKNRKLDIPRGLGKKEYARLWYKLYPIKTIKRMNRVRFGGQKEKVFQRDNYRCVECGMTNEEHKKKYKCNLSVNHIDHKGRYSVEQNNELNNLETLCISCHGRKDRQDYLKLLKVKKQKVGC